MTAQTVVTIRVASQPDLQHLGALDHDSDQLFRTVGMDVFADMPMQPPEYYAHSQSLDQIWVAESPSQPEPIAFVQFEVFENDGVFRTVYIHQVSVSLKFARKGIGARLMAFVEEWAKERGLKALDLTTFNDVPWNRPYYERLGFKLLADDELSKNTARDIKKAKEKEESHELLKLWKRVAMRKLL